MRLIVQAKIGGEYHVKVEPGATVYDIQCLVWSTKGVHPSHQQLTYQGIQLEPNQQISHYKIPDGAIVFLSYLPTGGNEVIVCLFNGELELVLNVSPKASVSDLKHLYWKEVKKRKLTKDKPIEKIELIYNDEILDDKVPLHEYKIGYQKETYIFVAHRISRKLTSRSIGTGVKTLSLEDEDDGIMVYYIKMQASNGESDLLVVGGDMNVSQLKQRYVDRRRSEARMQDFRLVSEGKPLSDEMKVSQFALVGQKTYLEVQTSARAADDMALIQAEFDQALVSVDFQKQARGAKKSLAERSAIGMARLDTYHDIKAIEEEHVSMDIKKATALTSDLLETKPSGQLNQDTLTAAHVLNNLFRQNNEEVLIYDSRKGITLQDSSSTVDDLFLPDKPMVLRLENLDGLGPMLPKNHVRKKTGSSTNALANIQAAIETSTRHPVLEDVASRLGRCLDVDKDRIRIIEVFQGSVCFEYTVDDLSPREREAILQQDTTGRLASAFQNFRELRIHPLLFRPAFDLAMFDSRGDKNFVNEGSTYEVGPTGNTKTYTQPKGWVRYGLNVLTGHADSDSWLHPFQDSGNWWRAFHGTANAGRYMPGVNSGSSDQMRNAAVSAMSGIHRNGFDMAHVAAYGPGVYCSPSPTWMEQNNYAAYVPVYVKGQDQAKIFRVMLQVAVRPGNDTLQPSSTNNIWVVKNRKWIRAYGILIREEGTTTTRTTTARRSTASTRSSCAIQ